MPRWVKVTLVVVAAAALVLVLLVLFAPAEHGPGRHLSHATTAAATMAAVPPGALRG